MANIPSKGFVSCNQHGTMIYKPTVQWNLLIDNKTALEAADLWLRKSLGNERMYVHFKHVKMLFLYSNSTV